jgi:hypothetical protein
MNQTIDMNGGDNDDFGYQNIFIRINASSGQTMLLTSPFGHS